MVNDPQKELNKIYEFLGEEPFEHTFDNLSNQHREDDITTYGLGDMHEVHSKLEKVSSTHQCSSLFDKNYIMIIKKLLSFLPIAFQLSQLYNQNITSFTINKT